jgi:hypothetical protein
MDLMQDPDSQIPGRTASVKPRKPSVKQADCLRVDMQVAIQINTLDTSTLVAAEKLVEAARAAFGKDASVMTVARLGKVPADWFPQKA